MAVTHPSISIVICTYNRDRFIRAALESLIKQELNKAFYEVLVIDNRSTDQTARIVQEVIAQNPDTVIRYFYEENKGLSHARNRGYREAGSEIITYIDDDAEATPEFAASLLQFFEHHPEAVGAGGKVLPKYPDGEEPVWMSHYLYGFVAGQDHGDQLRKYDRQMKYPAGCNMSYRKAALEKAGGFNTDLQFRSDDKAINFRVRQFSQDIWYVPAAVVYHNIDAERLHPDNFRKLYLKTGNEEKIRVRAEKGSWGLFTKGLEFVFKWKVSWLIGLKFLLAGTPAKGRYLIKSQWYTLKGFFMKNVFVR